MSYVYLPYLGVSIDIDNLSVICFDKYITVQKHTDTVIPEIKCARRGPEKMEGIVTQNHIHVLSALVV